MDLSVIICTHNPRKQYLERVLKGLAGQTLSSDRWELLLVDNASETVLAQSVALNWHPHSRHVREERLGLANARIRGIKEAKGDLLVFVDDDNVLAPDYLTTALEIGRQWPMMGAWGGQTIPEFEISPPAWTKPHWHFLAIDQFERDCWSNQTTCGTHPCGAGMCIRKTVALRWTALVESDPRRSRLGRQGDRLLCCEDTDMAYTACDMGLGMGKFTKLRLTHLIPAERLTEDYLLGVAAGVAYSCVILESFRHPLPPPPRIPLLRRIRRRMAAWRKPPDFEEKLRRIKEKMTIAALNDLQGFSAQK